MYYKQAQVAANWWIEEMKKRCSIIYPDKVIRDGSGFIVTDDSLSEDLSRFQVTLVAEIQNCLEKGYFLSLSCYFYPNQTLTNIAKKAHISKTYFPIRASMDILLGEIFVSINDNNPSLLLQFPSE